MKSIEETFDYYLQTLNVIMEHFKNKESIDAQLR